jgi:hypothetical protein
MRRHAPACRIPRFSKVMDSQSRELNGPPGGSSIRFSGCGSGAPDRLGPEMSHGSLRQRPWHRCCSSCANMPVRPLNLEIARSRIHQIRDRALQEEIERALVTALERWARPEGISDSTWNRRLPAADFDLLFFVEILAALQTAAPEAEPWRTVAHELFGTVPAEGFVEEELLLEELTVEEDLDPPEELAFPEDVLRPIEEEPPSPEDPESIKPQTADWTAT